MRPKKIIDESGSTMLLSIFLLALVSIIIISFSVQIGNQIKSTKISNDNKRIEYLLEGMVEEELYNIMEDILTYAKVYAIKKNIGGYGEYIYTLEKFEINYPDGDTAYPNDKDDPYNLKGRLPKVEISTETGQGKLKIQIVKNLEGHKLDSEFDIVFNDIKDDENINKPKVSVGYKLSYETIRWDKSKL